MTAVTFEEKEFTIWKIRASLVKAFIISNYMKMVFEKKQLDILTHV